MVKFKADSLAERLIIKPTIEKVSKGGIVIAQSARNQAINTNKGEVFMIGPQCWYDLPEKPNIKVGDLVYYAHFGAKVMKVEGYEDFFVLVNDKDILVAFEEVSTEETPNE